MIGGNVNACIQVKGDKTRNSIGEVEHTWTDVAVVKGFLDYMGGQSEISKYNAKIQETTHIFLCDFLNFRELSKQWTWNPLDGDVNVIQTDTQTATVGITSDNARMVILGHIYQILMMDDPMGLHQHLEIYLKYVGGGQGAH